MSLDPKDICFLVSYDEAYSDMARITVDRNIKPYCKLHGYTLWENKIGYLHEGRTSQWQKIKTSIELLKNNNFKWLFFMDTDCLIMHTPTKLESLIDENFSFILPAHQMPAIDYPYLNSQGTNNIITSHYLVKNDEIGLEILQDIWDAKELQGSPLLNTHDYEGRQTRLTIQKEKFNNKIKVVEERLLSRFWYMNSPFMVFRARGINSLVWQPGDFSVHVTGYPKERRNELLSDLNYFSGGLLTNWEKDEMKISFCPIVDVEYANILIYNTDKQLLGTYQMNSLTTNFFYRISISDIKETDIVVEVYDQNNNQIALKLFE